MTNLVSTSIQDKVLTIRLNRPEKKNALTRNMYDSISKAFEQAATEPDVRAIVLCGSGGSFSAGNDLNDFLQDIPATTGALARFFSAFLGAQVPIVAAVDGVAVGIGVTLLLHCDLVYISKSSKLSLPFVNLGLVPEFGSSMLLPRLVGHQRAAELLLLGEPFTPEQALEMGLANAVCESDELEIRAMTVASKLASKPRQSLIESKGLLRRAPETLSARMQEEADIFIRLLGSPDAIEAMSAIMEKRKPNFS